MCMGGILGAGGPAAARADNARPACSRWIVSHPLAYPALEVVHIVGIALLLGNLVLLELRVWGLGAELPVRAAGAAGAALCRWRASG